jgi:hypothetical protein
MQSTKCSDGKKKGWKRLSSNNSSIQDSLGNEENGYPVPDPNQVKINVTKKPSDAHKKKKKKH